MNIIDLISSRRTIRRFKQTEISFTTLTRIVNAGRLAPSARNLQPLEFIVVNDHEMVAHLFPLTRWAGYLPPEQGYPPPGKEPVAYIVVLINRAIRKEGGGEDIGAAMENMILAALSEGIGSCWIGSLDRVKLRLLCKIPETFEIAAVLALGYPDEQPLVEDSYGSIEYYKDENGCLHVPKKPLVSVLHHNIF